MSLHFEFDESSGVIRIPALADAPARELQLDNPEAFRLVSQAWLRAGWDTKYVYGFSWLGRPVIQLPEDLIRIQELIYELKPDIIIETGVAHGGSLVFYASLCAAIGKGRVLGIDIEIRPHNRVAIEQHVLSRLITLVEGSSVDPAVVDEVSAFIGQDQTVLVLLDSNHSLAHVASELECYSPFVTPGSYIVVCDGIMKQVAGAPRSSDDWTWNNPISAVHQFLAEHSEFELHEPQWPFNEGFISERVSYWPQAYLRRLV